MVRWRRQSTAFYGRWDISRFRSGAADLASNKGVPVYIVVVVAVANHRGPRRIERNLEVIRQVAVRRHTTNDEPGLRDISTVNHVVARCDLAESGAALYVGAESIEHIPVRAVVPRRQFVAAVPDYAYCSGRTRCHPWKNRGLSVRSIANPNSLTPVVTLIRRELDKDVMIVRVTGIDSAVGGDLHRKEQMRVTCTRHIVRRVSKRR